MGINAIGFKENACISENAENIKSHSSESASIFSEQNDDSISIGGLIGGFAVGLAVGLAVFKHRKNLKGLENPFNLRINKATYPNTSKLEATVDDLFENIQHQQHNIRVFNKAKKAGYNMSEAEALYCKEIISEFDLIYPNKRLAYAYADMIEETKRHINGDITVIKRDLDSHCNTLPFPRMELKTASSKKLSVYQNRFSGDEHLISEYQDFIGEMSSDETLFKEFVTHRSMNHIKENGILFSDLNEMRVSQAKGEIVKKAEEKYYRERDYMYSKLWRPYPTQQFYRVIGEEELMKLLKGETIISKNSKERYGRWCVDITPNAYYHDIYYGEPKFRISFKRKNAEGKWNTDFTSKIYEFRPEKSHYQVPSYSHKDVNLNDIRYWDGSDWQLVQFE